MYNSLGNHGRHSHVPEYLAEADGTVVLSSGSYQMDTYCCVNGTNSRELPRPWYAFNVGRARFYMLDATWPNGNLGTGTIYSDDNAAHWPRVP